MARRDVGAMLANHSPAGKQRQIEKRFLRQAALSIPGDQSLVKEKSK